MDTRMKGLTSRWRRAMLTASFAAALAGAVTFANVVYTPVASAIIGRPFTPMSYAGVARRSSRRVARRTIAYSGAAYATTLPTGCGTMAGGVYNCGSAAYQPYYDGPNMVYVEVDD